MFTGPVGLIAIGFVVGAIGTLIGAGGGFLLVPILLLLDPEIPSAVVTGISLAVVFFNAASGSIAYGRMGRIDYRAGVIFGVAAIPGAIVGAYTTTHIPRHAFDPIFAGLLIAASAYLMMTTGKDWQESETRSYNVTLGIIISVGIGFISSVLGIGGGIIHVPILVKVLHFPVHIATATSHLVLSITTLVATLTHLLNGTLDGHFGTILWISIGAIAGAQAGAKFSNQIKGSWILRFLAAGLGLIGIRVLLPFF